MTLLNHFSTNHRYHHIHITRALSRISRKRLQSSHLTRPHGSMKWTLKVILAGESRHEVLILDIILIDVTFFNFSKKNTPDYMFFHRVWTRCIINSNHINDRVTILSLMNEKTDVHLANLVPILHHFMKNLKNLIW